jgi:hypothetical protein
VLKSLLVRKLEGRDHKEGKKWADNIKTDRGMIRMGWCGLN